MSEFLSTPSVWRVTGLRLEIVLRVGISIHTLRVEGDSHSSVIFTASALFLSTPSVWRVTRILWRVG